MMLSSSTCVTSGNCGAKAEFRALSTARAADIAQQMGLNACHIDGGFEAWKAFGGEVEEKKKR